MELAIQKDCEEIIESFIANENPRFESFVYQWKSTLFQSIYSGQSQTVEIIQSTNVCIHYAKRVLAIPTKSTFHKLGALFLLYAIYFKQPTDRFQKIDIDIKSWKKLKEFVFSLDNSTYGDDAKCIFLELVKDNAFKFVASDIYFGLENLLNLDKIRSNVANLNTSIHAFRNDMKSLNSQNGLFLGIQKLDDGYNEMKELLNQNGSSNEARYVMPASKGFQDLKKAVTSLQTLIDESYSSLVGKMKKKKDKVKKKARIGKIKRSRVVFHK
ncbi:snRNA-activating protein complex subunit 1 [Eupeodes corollae]|uniref:snRNA-activating protein complex subunit 1 n=1 Tax=Eupeodes corollae TaxID=290404 RepID=UPI00249108A4|nr:snRNA-activating protein complex subunit 1 [Eupeodes corollae]